MRFPWLDSLLLLCIVIGAFYLWQSASERARLQPEYQRLKQVTGELTPTDPAKVYVRAIPTDDPLDFAWRVYFPANYRLHVRHSSGSSSGSSSNPVNTIARVRLQEIDGRWQVYKRVAFGSSLSSLEPQVGEWLRDNSDQLQVEQLGREKTEEFDTSENFVLLKLTMPDQEKHHDVNSSDNRPAGQSKPFLKLTVGPPK